jgi:hypothetical protein
VQELLEEVMSPTNTGPDSRPIFAWDNADPEKPDGIDADYFFPSYVDTVRELVADLLDE